MRNTTAVKRQFFCPVCDAQYTDCEHTDKHQIRPKEESGRVISNMEFLVLLDAGEI